VQAEEPIQITGASSERFQNALERLREQNQQRRPAHDTPPPRASRRHDEPSRDTEREGPSLGM